jgi:hypothetical protein
MFNEYLYLFLVRGDRFLVPQVKSWPRMKRNELLEKVKRIEGYRNGRQQEFWEFLLILFLKGSRKRGNRPNATHNFVEF